MPPRASAGVLIYRRGVGGALEVLLGHYGGPFWANRDQGAWTVFKGRSNPGETPLETAVREFQEETGWDPPSVSWQRLPRVKTPHQVMDIWAMEADFDPALLRPGLFSMEWPRGSGRQQEFPEIDRVQWFTLSEAHTKMPTSQRVLLNHLSRMVNPPTA